MKILITGGCGFLGSNIAASYLADGAEIVIIDALLRVGSEANREWLKTLVSSPSQLRFYQFDLADHELVNQVFQSNAPFDYICHVGGQVAMTTSLAEPRRDMLTNIVGTFNVLEAMRRYSPDSLLAYSSTNKVYGDLEKLRYVEMSKRYSLPDYPNGLDEAVPLDFASPYGCSKGSADQYVRDWHRNYGLKTVVFRHSSIYGGRQFSTFDQGWIGWFCKMAIIQKRLSQSGKEITPFTISGSGKQVRDVLHATDLVQLYKKAFVAKAEIAGEVFNVGGGGENSLSLLELFDHLCEILCLQDLEYTSLARRQSDQDYFVADIRKVGGKIGWRPETNVRRGLENMVTWEGGIAKL